MAMDAVDALFLEVERLKRVQRNLIWGMTLVAAGSLLGGIALIIHVLFTYNLITIIWR